MSATRWMLRLALIAAVAAPAWAAAAEESSGDAESTPAKATAPGEGEGESESLEDAVDEEWLNTIWTQVDDMVKSEEIKLQETVVVAGVRGAEAEDEILDKLYYKGAKRYPSQDKLNKAIETLKKAVADSPKGPNAPMQKYFIAQCYEKLGRQADARTYYERVTKEHAGTTWAAKAGKDLTRMAAAQ